MAAGSKDARLASRRVRLCLDMMLCPPSVAMTSGGQAPGRRRPEGLPLVPAPQAVLLVSRFPTVSLICDIGQPVPVPVAGWESTTKTRMSPSTSRQVDTMDQMRARLEALAASYGSPASHEVLTFRA